MAKSRSKARWPLAFKATGLNGDTNLLKLIAMVTMLCDHTGKMLFHSNLMRIFGRVAFPIYAYCIAVGCIYTKNHLKYLSRLVLVGLISQPFYAVAMAHTYQSMYAIPFRENPIGAVVNFYVESWGHPSVFFTLALGLLVVWSIREKQPVLTLALALFIWKARGSIDYGWKGVALVALFYLFSARWWMSLPVVGAFMLWWALQGNGYKLFGLSFGIQVFALLALIPIHIRTHSGLKINKWVFYLFYPGHLIGILLIEIAMKNL
jgi:hypothetical protein